MRTVLAWQETPPEKDGVRSVCYDLCFSPDGTQLVAGVGCRVLVYDATDGDLLHALKGHKDSVYAVAYAANGKRFASAGADKTVVIWTSKAEGILKYTHDESVQCLAYNPITQQLASGTASDMGLWSPEQKSVTKHKVASKVISMAWTADGMSLALGCFDGSISIRDKAGSEQVKISSGTTPVWTLSWSAQDQPVLAVGSLDGMLRFFTSSGTAKYKERKLEGGCLSLAYFNAEYLVISTTDKVIQLATKEGVPLTQITTRSSWGWKVAARPRNNYIASGCEDGSIAVHQLAFSTVHGIYHERYAYRDVMTDVIIQHLLTEQKVRIKCRDYVKKIAVYKERVAVQLPSKVVLYELAPGSDAYDMQYRSAAKIHQKLDCNLLVVTSAHIILCQEKTLQMYNFDGVKEREWVLDAAIRYIKVVGGPPRREGLLVGLKSGAVVKIYIDNPFPIPLISHNCGVRCLDLSAGRKKVAIVDEQSCVAVYDLTTKEMIFTEKNANSVSWNLDFEDMLCYSGNGFLSIKTADFALHTQRLQGFVVGFKGSKVFCLQSVAMQTIDVPQTTSMHRFLEQGDYDQAYRVACLGVTEADWKALGLEALKAFSLEVAQQAFIRARDVHAVELVASTSSGLAAGVPQGVLSAQIEAWQGNYQEAAKLFVQEGQVDKALEMFTSLRMFDEAKHWAEEAARVGKGGPAGDAAGAARVVDLIGRQAQWSEETANYEAAVEMYIKAKKYERAMALILKHSWWERLSELVRQLDKTADKAHLRAAAVQLRRAGQYAAAKEALLKLEDVPGLLSLAVEEEKWEDAFLLLHAHPEHKPKVYLPYAQWLCVRDRFSDALDAYKQAGRPEKARVLLQQLAGAAIDEGRFADASHCYYQMAMEELQAIQNSPAHLTAEDRTALTNCSTLYETAEVYYAYAQLHTSCHLPFKTLDDHSLFNAARFLLLRLLGREAPTGVSMVDVLMTVATGAVTQKAFKLARFAYGKLQTMVLSPALADTVDLQSVVIRAQPFTDSEELLPLCYRCQTTNPLVNTQGNYCVNCGAPFLHSFVTFEALPLVEFELEPGISDVEAQALFGEDTSPHDEMGMRGRQQQMEGGANVLRLDNEGPGFGMGGAQSGALEDSFAVQALVAHAPIQLGRAALRRLRPCEVHVRRWPNPHLPCQYFRVLDPSVPVAVGPCGHFFEAEEYEMYVLEHGYSPFSRVAASRGDEEQHTSSSADRGGDARQGKDQAAALLGKRVTSGSRVEAGPSIAGKATAGTRGAQWPTLS